MSETIKKATRAESLRVSKLFQEFHSDVFEAQVAVFRNPSSTEDERAEAHAMIRALDKIKAQLDRVITSAKMEKKRASRKP